LPADDSPIEVIAKELIDSGLIVPYEVDGVKYAEIPTFSKHQVINNRESPSTLPARVHDASPRVKAEGRKEGKERKEDASKQRRETLLPKDFEISESVRKWAAEHGYNRLEERLDHFKDWAISKAAKYSDWDAAFRNAIKGDWAKLQPCKPVLSVMAGAV